MSGTPLFAESADLPRGSPLPVTRPAPLLLGMLAFVFFWGGVRPAVAEARRLAARRDALRAENAALEREVDLLRRAAKALRTDAFLNERLRRLEFRTGPAPAPHER